jgi:iron complex outermembrane recepter protein
MSLNNLFNSHSQTSVTPGGALVNQTFTSSSPGFTAGVNLADNPTLMPGRSVMLSVVFGFSPKR